MLGVAGWIGALFILGFAGAAAILPDAMLHRLRASRSHYKFPSLSAPQIGWNAVEPADPAVLPHPGVVGPLPGTLQEVEATSEQEFKASVLGAYERGEERPDDDEGQHEAAAALDGFGAAAAILRDAARFTAKPIPFPYPVETFAFNIDDIRDSGATLALFWENIRVPITIEVDTVAKQFADAAQANIAALTKQGR